MTQQVWGWAKTGASSPEVQLWLNFFLTNLLFLADDL